MVWELSKNFIAASVAGSDRRALPGAQHETVISSVQSPTWRSLACSQEGERSRPLLGAVEAVTGFRRRLGRPAGVGNGHESFTNGHSRRSDPMDKSGVRKGGLQQERKPAAGPLSQPRACVRVLI